MRVVSVNTGLPRKIDWQGTTIATGIFKEPVTGQVAVRATNLDGDGQADLAVHGGESKAVYAYAAEHYEFWRRELPATEVPPGAFGENLTTEGLPEEDVRIGDRFRVGTATLVTTEPRLPCFKLGIRLGRPDIVERFLASGRTGFYLRVEQEGYVAAGDPIVRIGRDPRGVLLSEATRLHTTERGNVELIRRVLSVPALGESWRRRLSARLDKIGGR